VRNCWLATLLGCWLFAALASASHAGADDGVDGWSWPLDPRPAVLRGFDPPAQPWLAGHRGVDLAGAQGQPVLSAGTGIVSYAGRLAGVGIVVVRHGELRTTYQPVRASVQLGEAVDAGEVIGRLEELGSHCRPVSCLHWGLLRGRTYLDPLTLVRAGPPRLLPLDGAAQSNSFLADRATPADSALAAPNDSAPAERDEGIADAVALAAGLGGAAAALLVTRRLRRDPTGG
jgi:murein DD-endopeptidase MepM/ murein hydrolase activator NlpD